MCMTGVRTHQAFQATFIKLNLSSKVSLALVIIQTWESTCEVVVRRIKSEKKVFITSLSLDFGVTN